MHEFLESLSDYLARANLTDASVAHAGGPMILAFSGGLDSSLLASRMPGSRAVVLTAGRNNRDLPTARRAAEVFGLLLTEEAVAEDRVLELIDRHRSLLKSLSDYTQRILAICEICLIEAAVREGALLVTGHGPEAIFGGFRRRSAPDALDSESIARTVALNRARLEAVMTATGRRILTPYFEPRVFAALMALRLRGETRETLRDRLPFSVPTKTPKAALQNGSGVHYLFERIARRHGAARTRDHFEKLVA
jgi:asparagine synthetase B (glutamine-hydrolysing)